MNSLMRLLLDNSKIDYRLKVASVWKSYQQKMELANMAIGHDVLPPDGSCYGFEKKGFPPREYLFETLIFVLPVVVLVQ